MRPKKRILLVDADENRASVRRFVLQTHGYAVTLVTTVTGREAWLPFELAIVGMPRDESACRALLLALHRADPQCAQLLLAEGKKVQPQTLANFCLFGVFTNEAMLDQVKLMSARKRGPRKGWQKEPASVTADIAIVGVA